MKRIMNLGGTLSGIAASMRELKRDETRLREEGDRARDQREWAIAEQSYKAYLTIVPGDAAIWIQLGHALKEQGLYVNSEEAYRNALTLSPEDADGYLQLGHVVKLQGRKDEAREAYLRSLHLTPSRAAHDELQGLGEVSSVDSNLNIIFDDAENLSNVTLYEINDLFGYLRAHKTLSGIQRVQVGIIHEILNLKERETEHKFVSYGKESDGYWKIQPTDLKNIISYATGLLVNHQKLIDLINDAEKKSIPVRPSSGDTHIILGAFWGFNLDISRYSKLKDAGVRIGVYIYDLIPLSHPEYCDFSLANEFAMALGDGLLYFDFILTISEYTANQVRNLLARYDLRPIPVKAVPLAHVLGGFARPVYRQTAAWSDNILALRDRRFVLMVSTIEARKNHAYLVSIWKLFIEAELDPPDLVFVGRPGWRVDDFMKQLEASDYLDGRVRILHDLSDIELSILYDNCLFTAFPSFVEGWGLPVGESLAHGCPCIASNSTSIPEVGGDLVDYVDPFNIRDGFVVFKRMAFDEAYRTDRRNDIKNRFKSRQWSDVAKDFLKEIDQIKLSQIERAGAPILRSAELFAPADFCSGRLIPGNYPSKPLRSILAESWYPAESFGAWMRGKIGKLRFCTDLVEGTKLTIYLKLIASPWSGDMTLKIEVGDAIEERRASSFPRTIYSRIKDIETIPNREFWAHVTGHVVKGGIEITLHASGYGNSPAHDARTLSIGLISMVYCETDNVKARTDIVEYIMFDKHMR